MQLVAMLSTAWQKEAEAGIERESQPGRDRRVCMGSDESHGFDGEM